jgi:asparagine synthase (glutamine-hydrolysing)
MCGIVGELNINKIDLSVFNSMRDVLTHRGPDGAGTILLNDDTVGLGHRRLSIIDLTDSGKQPMSNEDGSKWITFNGEIYNYQVLRTELLKCGHTFRSTSDTEVILHGYEQWGNDVVNRLNGMFAFGLWDDTKKQLLLARDRFGIKPLHYSFSSSHFCFASEIKALLQNPSVKRD